MAVDGPDDCGCVLESNNRFGPVTIAARVVFRVLSITRNFCIGEEGNHDLGLTVCCHALEITIFRPTSLP
jgi:hypothetical protein